MTCKPTALWAALGFGLLLTLGCTEPIDRDGLNQPFSGEGEEQGDEGEAKEAAEGEAKEAAEGEAKEAVCETHCRELCEIGKDHEAYERECCETVCKDGEGEGEGKGEGEGEEEWKDPYAGCVVLCRAQCEIEPAHEAYERECCKMHCEEQIPETCGEMVCREQCEGIGEDHPAYERECCYRPCEDAVEGEPKEEPAPEGEPKPEGEPELSCELVCAEACEIPEEHEAYKRECCEKVCTEVPPKEPL